jgi:hypothetical protein
MMTNFNDDSDKPVSAHFTAPIPESASRSAEQKLAPAEGPGTDTGIPGQYKMAMYGVISFDPDPSSTSLTSILIH